MVGLLIASLSTLLIMQVSMLFESQKRTTLSGGDAQNTGAIALYSLQRDIHQGGYGLSALPIIGCGLTLPSGVTLTMMVPVTINPATSIVPAGDANTDTILVAYGNNQGSPEGGLISQAASNVYTLDSALVFSANDRVVAAPQTRPATCALTLDTVTAVNTTTQAVTVQTGASGVVGGRLYNLGPAPTVLAYAIRGGNLTVCDYIANNCGTAGSTSDPAIWRPVANNVVSVRAQYGRDTNTPMDGIVDVYDQTTPSSASTTLNCDWARISAVRLVVVARNSNPEKTTVTLADPSWNGSVTSPLGLSVTTVPTGFTWQSFRYKTFETVIPLRNIAQAGAQAGC